MCPLVQRVAAQAAKIFSGARNRGSILPCREQIKHLVSMLDEVTPHDLNFSSPVVINDEYWTPGTEKSPITFIQIWEDKTFTMGIFILRGGAVIPLHDHPGMHGFIRCIHGNLKIRSYSQLPASSLSNEIRESLPGLRPWQEDYIVPVKAEPIVFVNAESPTCELTPTAGNIHEVSSIDGPAAFLDILGPPYDHDNGTRVCHYYRVLGQVKHAAQPGSQDTVAADNEVNVLLRTSQPRDFWGEGEDYKGPKLEPYREME